MKRFCLSIALAATISGSFGSRAQATEAWSASLTDAQAAKILNEFLDGPGTAPTDIAVKCSQADQRDPRRILEAPTEQDFVESLTSVRIWSEWEVSSYLGRAKYMYEQAQAKRCGISLAEAAAVAFYTGAGFRDQPRVSARRPS